MGVVIRRWVWLECIGVVSGCCYKAVYINRIAEKFGGNYIWRFGLQTLKLNIGGI